MDYQVPESAIYESAENQVAMGFVREANTAQYGGADYANAVRVERGISLEEAFDIAANDPEIAYFFRVKGGMMVLPVEDGSEFDFANDPLHLVTENTYILDSTGEAVTGLCRIFLEGDTVFFSQEGKWLGSAEGLADTYTKQ